MEITVAVVADDARLRSAFAHAVLCAPGMALVGASDALASGRTLVDSQRPDVLLVDQALPDGIELIQHVAQHCPWCDAMVIAASQDQDILLAEIKAGATGFVQREIDGSTLAEQLRVLHAGGSPIAPTTARQLLRLLAVSEPHAPNRAAQQTPAIPLSAQERKVLEIASKGYVYDDIAKMMGVSRETVLTYAKRIYRKLKVHTKTEAIYEARCLGWLLD